MVAIDFQVRHAWIFELLQYISLFPSPLRTAQMPCKVTCRNVTMSQTDSKCLQFLLHYIRVVYSLYVVQIFLLTFLHG